MIERIKYGLQRMFSSKLMRIGSAVFLSAITVVVITLLNCSVYTFNISDGEKSFTVRSLNSNVTKALSNVSLKSNSYNVNRTVFDGKNANISISYTYPVYITRGEVTVTVEFSGGTVADAIKSAGFSLDEFDFVEPSADTEITKTCYIDFTDISYINSSATELIPYKTERSYSNDMEKNAVTLVQAGVNGSKQVDYCEKLVNGVSVEKVVTNTTVLSAAVNEKKIVGTKVTANPVTASANVNQISTLTPDFSIELDANGNPVNYKSVMTVRATAYTYTGHNCSTGVAPQPGYIAVNPNVIPYGTKMYIKTANGRIVYGYAVAADTGGFTRKHPTGVDLFMGSYAECKSFGVKNVDIYILE